MSGIAVLRRRLTVLWRRLTVLRRRLTVLRRHHLCLRGREARPRMIYYVKNKVWIKVIVGTAAGGSGHHIPHHALPSDTEGV